MILSELEKALDLTWALIKEQQEKAENAPVLSTNQPEIIRKKLGQNLPGKSSDFQNLLADFEREILPFMNHNKDPRYGAYITGSGNPVSAIAEFIKAFYNQNGLKWNNSPIASELEQLVIRWVAEYSGLPEYSKGVITSGGSMSNLMGLHFALADRFPEREKKGLFGTNKLTVYCSDQTHSSIDRAMVFLGLGRDQLRKIPVDDAFKIQLNGLKQTIDQDKKAGFTPFVLVGNAGTTNTGSIDDLDGLADVAEEFGLWYHVDGAYGLPARRLHELNDLFKGVEKADSVIINPHKWMYVTFEASCILVKEIPKAIHFAPDYLFTENQGLRWESSEHTIELSKEFRALKIWFTMKYYGAEKLTEFVRHDIAMTDLLAEKLENIPHIKIEPSHPLSILCFRWEDPDLTGETNEQININAIRRIESEGNIFITGTRLRGKTYLRIYFGNPERNEKDVEEMVAVIARTFNELFEY